MATTKPVDGKKYDYLVAKLAEMNGELKRSQLRETEAQQTIKSLRQNMSFFEGQANKSKVAEKELQQRISELMDAYASIEAQANASPRSELAWERQKHHIIDLADENKHLEAELGQAERQITKLEDQVKVDEQKSKQQVEHLQKRLNKLKREKDMQNVHQASEISHLRLKLYNKDQRIQEMQTKANKLRDKILRRDARIESLRDVLQDAMVPADSTHVVKKRVIDPKTHPNIPTQQPPSPPQMSTKRRMSFQTEQDTKEKIANRRRLS